MLIIKKTIKIILLISIILFAVSYFQKDNLPDKQNIVSQLDQKPIQSETSEKSFTVEKEGVVYEIKPLFDYELYGLVVSYNNSKNWFDYYHEKWNDFINIKDLCVIWGDNINSEVYKSMKFKSGSWTCFAKFKNNADENMWSKFRNDSLSNNHILSNDEEINKKLMNVEEGDQIYLKGYLVEYSNSEGFKRGSSTLRTDTGNGACETIYITDFQIIKKGNEEWHSLYDISKYSIIICLIILFLFLFIPTKRLVI